MTKKRGSVLRGFVYAAVLVFLVQSVVYALWVNAFPKGTSMVFLQMVVLSPGWNQLFYLPVLAYRFFRKGLTETAQGVVMTSLLLFLLSSVCNVALGSLE